MIIPDLIRKHAQRRPDRAALVSGDVRLTWSELDRLVDRLAAGFNARGVGGGARVALLLGNDYAPEAVSTYLAVHRAGAVNVPMNTRLAAPEIVKILQHAEAEVLVGPSALVEAVRTALPEGSTVRLFVTVDEERSDSDMTPWRNLPNDGPAPEATTGLDDLADLIYTSGTTAEAKGTMHTHRSALHVSLAKEALDISPDDVYQTPIPFYTSSGCHTYLLPALNAGTTMVIDPAFDVATTLHTLQAEGTTIYFGVPAMLGFILNSGQVSNHDVSTLQQLFYGGSIMPSPLVEQIRTQLPGVRLANLYGLTEAGPGGTVLHDEFAASKPGSVGRPMPPFTEQRLVDDAGQDVDPGEVGEVLLRTPSAMTGYFKDPQRTAEAVQGGWIHTGDLGRLDDEGFLYIVDRKKDMVVRGGFNIYPAEVEAVLQQHPGVLEVAVVGRPHPQLGEDLVAYVVRRDESSCSEADLKALTVEQLADFKRPRTYQFIEELPRNAMGKILKRALRGDA